jgi:hypothetical protein
VAHENHLFRARRRRERALEIDFHATIITDLRRIP